MAPQNKKKNMKRFLSIVTIALALASCVNDSEVEQPNNQPTPIVFGEVSTRVDITNADVEENGFGVIALVNTGANGVYESLFGANPEKIWLEDGNWIYDEANVKYWCDNCNYHFFGVYPHDEAYTIATDASGNPTGVSHTFITPTTADKDLIMAYTPVDTSKTPPTQVEMTFNHALTKVNFIFWRDRVNNENDQMRIKQVMLVNLKSEGTLTRFNDSSASWEYTAKRMNITKNVAKTDTESDYISAATFNVETAKLDDTSNPKPASKPFGEDGLLLLPQSIDGSNSVGLRVVYELLMPDAVDWQEKTIETLLPTITWVGGKEVNYQILLSSSVNIAFYHIQTSIDPWGTPQVGGTVIIK